MTAVRPQRHRPPARARKASPSATPGDTGAPAASARDDTAASAAAARDDTGAPAASARDDTAASAASARGTSHDGPAPAADAAALSTRLSQWGAVLAPTTVATAMLLYFGYIATRARFAYFGVYLDLTDLSSRDLVLYGIEVLYLPLAVMLLAVLVVAAAHLAGMWAVARRAGGRTVPVAAAFVALAGVLLTARAVIGLAVAQVSRDERPGSTALALAAGPVVLAYAGWIATRARPPGPWYAQTRRLRLVAVTAVAGLALTGLFWAGTSFAWRLGEGRAYDDALQLPDRPEVVLDTGERLVDLPPYVQETTLPAERGDTFRYRYRGLRLLIQAGGRLFLVPEHWTAQGRTLILPYDDSVRLQVIPRPPA